MGVFYGSRVHYISKQKLVWIGMNIF
jgi:hypothetical protein